MKNIIGILGVFILAISCSGGKKESADAGLELTEDSVVYLLADNVTLGIRALFPFIDKDGHEYLTFQNQLEPEICVYDLQSGEFVKSIFFDREGANGVGMFGGYHIIDFDEIYLPSLQQSKVFVMEESGKKKREIITEKTDDGIPLLPFGAITFAYRPIYFNNGKMYIPQTVNMRLGNKVMEKSPVYVVVDTVKNVLSSFPIKFPPIMSSDDVTKPSLGNELSYSCCLNDKDQFVFSFFFDEDIYVVSLQDGEMKKIKVKSRYIDKPAIKENPPQDFDGAMKASSEIPCYGNLIYDKYRKVYYRFVYLKADLDGEKNYLNIWQYGRKSFSIMILNEDFDVIGETRFPDFTYISTLHYIGKDGLYLSDSHYKNPSFDENKLRFRRFKLVHYNKK